MAFKLLAVVGHFLIKRLDTFIKAAYLLDEDLKFDPDDHVPFKSQG